MKIQYGLRAILILVLAAGMFMSGWVANDSYRTMQAKRKAGEDAKQASKISDIASMNGNVQIESLPGIGISIKGAVADVMAVENAIEKFTSESNANDEKAVEIAIEKLMSESNGK